MISYKPLMKTMIDKDMKKMDLRDAVGISNSTLSKFEKGEPVALSVIEKICLLFNCKIEDVVAILPNENT